MKILKQVYVTTYVKNESPMTQNIDLRWTGRAPASSAVVPYVEPAVNRQPGFRREDP